MDVDNDSNRAQAAVKVIKKLSDVALNNTSDDGEEFVRYNEVSSTSADESEDNGDLEVSSFIPRSRIRNLPLLL